MRLIWFVIVACACHGSSSGTAQDLAVPDLSVLPDLAVESDASVADLTSAGDLTNVDLAPSPLPNIAFTTASPSPLPAIAALGTGATLEDQVISGADAICAAEAANAGLSGTFVAWLSSSHHLATDRMKAKNPSHLMPAGWVRPDGKPFLAEIDADPHVYYPLMLTAAGGTPASSDYLVWTGTNADGTLAASNCSDWTSSASTDKGAAGRYLEGTMEWSVSYGLGQPCDQRALLYCFQVDRVAMAPSPSPMPSFKWAFATSTAFDPSTGLSGADSKCDDDAIAAGLVAGAGSFTAMLAPTGNSAASRLTSMPNVPYVRPDHVVVVAATSDLFSGATWLAPIDRAADGSDARTAFLGALSLSATATNNCNGWTDHTAGFTADTWEVAMTVPRSGGSICSGPLGVICLQK